MNRQTRCPPVERSQLKDPIDISAPSEVDFAGAKDIADRKARELAADPMLLSWYDRQSGKFSPQVDFCEFDNRPVWLVFAESRGGDITIDINKEQFVFVYADFS